ncbi:MAG: ABC transporter substrate-binding protein [Actinomycetota bacterium]|nr:ABC transporter substrate-binding protein [Actinomycetota bacterium]
MRLLAAATAVAVAASSCTDDGSNRRPDQGEGGTAPTGTAVPGGGVTFGVLGEPATLDPYSPLASDLTYWLARPVLPSLFRRDPEGAVRPDLAASLEVFGDRAVVTLRPARWSDGSRIVASDVVASIDRAQESPSNRSGFRHIRSAKARSRTEIVLRGPIDDWESTLARGGLVMPAGSSKAPLRVSGGPMELVSRTPGLQVVYEPNPDWYGQAAELDRVRVQFILSVEMMLALLERDRLDAAAIPSSLNLDERLDERGIDHAEARGDEVVYLDLEGAVSGRASRARLIAALDRGALKEGLIRDDGASAGTRSPPAPSRSQPDATVELAAPSGDELLTLMQRVMRLHYQRAGITAQLVTIDPFTYYGEWERDDPVDLALRRAVAPLGIDRTLGRFPLFEVDSVVAWNEGVVGPRPNPSLDGPLWNVERWRVVP